MRAYIRIWGNEYLLENMSWYNDGLFSHVSFRDEKDVFHVIHQKLSERGTDAEKNRDEEIKHADLEKIIFWKKK